MDRHEASGDERFSKALSELFDKLEWTPEERRDALQKVRENLDNPVRIIGIGQCGVGKTELLRSIFKITDDDLAVLRQLRTGATSATTTRFFSFRIATPSGLKVEFTDGPGLGEDEDHDDENIPAWIDEIPKHDLLYWVLDAASRDVAHIQRNMRDVLNATGYRDRFLLVLNKVDNIQLEESDRLAGRVGWNEKYNLPTKRLLRQIESRTDDIIKRFVAKVGLSPDQIVACSALKRWNHDLVLDRILDLLPRDAKVKVAMNRDVKSGEDLMDPEIRRRLDEDLDRDGR